MKKQTGFTIVELIIVVVVIGILAAVTAVSYSSLNERARLSAARAFAVQLEKKHLPYAEGYWQFDECSGTAVSSQTEITSTITGTLAWSTESPTGSGGCSGSFNGATRIRTTAAISSDYYLKAAWIKFNACGNNNIASAPDSGGVDAAFYIPNCRLFAGHEGSYGRISSYETLKANTWYHVAVEFDNGTYTLYLDGKKIRDSPNQPLITGTGAGVNIGAHRTGSYFNGLMDNVLIVGKRPEF